jgi:hypothetical protein
LHATAVGPDLSRYVAQLSRPLRELPEDPVPAQAHADGVSEAATAA